MRLGKEWKLMFGWRVGSRFFIFMDVHPVFICSTASEEVVMGFSLAEHGLSYSLGAMLWTYFSASTLEI